jgi:glycosyltransferase involved in cell wall biosynthesis
MKIGIMHNLYGQYSHGGAETVAERMINDLRATGEEVFLITTKPPKAAIPAAGDTPKDLKIYYLNSVFYNLDKIPIAGRLFWHVNNVFSFKKSRKIKKILTEEKPDLVITHNLMGLGFLTPLAIKKLKIKHYHFLHDIQLIHPSGLMIYGQENKINGSGAQAYQALTRALFASPAKIISPSRWLLNMHIERGFFKDSEIEIKPLDLKFTPAAATNNEKTAASEQANGLIRFLFLGQIEKQKGIFLLVEAFKKISDAKARLTIIFRNTAGQSAALKKIIGDDKRIEVLGPLAFLEANKIMAACDCLIVPSLCYENSPSVIYGAHANGLKIIASDIGGIPEIMAPGDVLFRPGDEEDLKRKINEFIKTAR